MSALDIASGELVELPIDVSATLGPVGMTTRADDRPTSIVGEFMKVTRATAERLRNDTAGTVSPTPAA